MTDDTVREAAQKKPVTLLGLGAMGTALADAWLTAGHPVTVWNRNPRRAGPLAARGAVSYNVYKRQIVLCLLDDDSVDEALAEADLTGRDLVNLTTGTPLRARDRAAWAQARGARFLDGGIMAVPPMIGVPESGGYVFYSGSSGAFEDHRDTLAVPAGTRYVGEDPGFAALHDVALLSAMYGAFSGITHAFALIRREDIDPEEFVPLLVDWLTAMVPAAHTTAARLNSGDHTTGVVSNLAMQVAGSATLVRTAEEQGVDTALLTPYLQLMERLLEEGGHDHEDTARVVDLLTR
ncbi:NAD(P)-dependent oxidoreductase [Streptomyces sp. NRRL S-15]|uniref:NAD(P)-dependent oxidoreductase n=1 Tax=Streptomyces sp. NRRL S-15 TaxID=1463886 RepID=UPI0004CB8BE6|nr:NAD(P)-binding domain-containing protein [Streptomyces sp. NRRL S-15]